MWRLSRRTYEENGIAPPILTIDVMPTVKLKIYLKIFKGWNSRWNLSGKLLQNFSKTIEFHDKNQFSWNLRLISRKVSTSYLQMSFLFFKYKMNKIIFKTYQKLSRVQTELLVKLSIFESELPTSQSSPWGEYYCRCHRRRTGPITTKQKWFR